MHRHLSSLVLTVAVMMCVTIQASGAQGDGSPVVEPAFWWFGPTPLAAAVRDDVLYVGAAGAGLQIFDVSDPSRSTRIDSTGMTPLDCSTVALSGNQVFASSVRGLRVFDVSDPTEPVHLGIVRLPGLGSPLVEAGPQHVYVSRLTGGIQVLERRPGRLPVVVGSIPDEQVGQSVGLRYREGLLYSANRELGLVIYDVTVPERPVRLESLEVPQFFAMSSLALQEHTDGRLIAHMGRGSGGIASVDVSDPDSPVLIGESTDVRAYSIETAGDRIITRTRLPRGMAVLDASIPESVVTVGQAETEASPRWTLAVQGDRVWVPTTTSIDAFDISEPARPTRVDRIREPIPAFPSDVAMQDGTIIVNDSYGRLIGVEVGPGFDLNITGVSFPSDEEAFDIEWVGEHLYRVGGDLEIFEMTDPAAPLSVARIELPGVFSRRSVVIGNGVLFSSRSGAIVAVDITTPDDPVILSEFGESSVRQLSLVGTTLLAADRDRGLMAYDVADPAAPFLRWATDDVASMLALAVVDDRAFVAGGLGMRVYDVADLGAVPTLLDTYPDWIAAHHDHDGGRLVQASGNRFRGIDIERPDAPRLLFEYGDIPGTLPGDGIRSSANLIEGRVLVGGQSFGGGVLTTGRLMFPCPADLDGSETVDTIDLLAVLAAWGPVETGEPADIDGDRWVGFLDLASVLAGWGPCVD